MKDTANFPHRAEYRATVAIYHLLVPVMIACLAVLIAQFALRIVPGWENGFLVPLCVFIAVEALLTTRLVRTITTFTPEWFFNRIAELVVIIISIKVLLYLLGDPAQLLQDVLLWDERFLETFFTGEMLAVSGIGLFVWALATQFAAYLLDMEESLEELEAESQGYVLRDRAALQHGLQVLVFSVGIVMMLLVTLLHVESRLFAPAQISLRASIFVMLAYFFLGFVLLALGQFFMQRARWYMQEVAVSPGIGLRWALYSLALLVGIGVIVVFLPTGYAGSLFEGVRLLVYFLIAVITGLILLVITPIFLLISFISRLFGGAAIAPPVMPPPVLPPQVEARDPDVVWMVLQSLCFWTVFFSVIVFSFRFYLEQRREGWEQLRKRRGFGWLFRLADWFKNVFHRAGDELQKAREITGERVTVMQLRLRLPAWTAVNRRLPAREQVLLTYRAMLEWNSRNGIPRKVGQTPYEYARILAAIAPANLSEIEAITASFMEARYTAHAIQLENARQMSADWARLRGGLRLSLAARGERRLG